MAKNRSNSFKGAPVLEELAAIADGHQLYGVPTDSKDQWVVDEYKDKGVAVFAPNGDIMPQLELLPWIVDLIDFIQNVVTEGGSVFEFMHEHELTIVSGHFWRPSQFFEDELHSMCVLRLDQTTISVETWLKQPDEGSELPYVSQQLIHVGGRDAYVTYWLSDDDPRAKTNTVIERLTRSIYHYKDWQDVEPACDRAQ